TLQTALLVCGFIFFPNAVALVGKARATSIAAASSKKTFLVQGCCTSGAGGAGHFFSNSIDTTRYKGLCLWMKTSEPSLFWGILKNGGKSFDFSF
ncbi:MAG: hypothetical protein QMD09_12100, partial [Desulfatibacillaceae bacterium]|nr:hypothetical protein [Desulfatibacillaceae bacterium]